MNKTARAPQTIEQGNYLAKMQYGKRWAVETFFSGLKRTMGSMLNSRRPDQLLKETAFRVLAYALRRQGACKIVKHFNRGTLTHAQIFHEVRIFSVFLLTTQAVDNDLPNIFRHLFATPLTGRCVDQLRTIGNYPT